MDSPIYCEACPRLRRHCLKVAREKRKAYANEKYWGKPITGFGDPQGRLVIVGLAPAAHGANRTGRIFTGDRSGDWLFRALYHAGFSNQPCSNSKDDGLVLKDAYVTCVVKCAPPDNKPSPMEQHRCISRYLTQEVAAISRAQVWVALGQIAYQGLWPLLMLPTTQKRSRPKFEHGKEIELSGHAKLILSYHPSQQNTFTGRLTAPMFQSVFNRARNLLD